MRYSLFTLLLFFTLSLSGATYYVATNGSDSNSGAIGSPWLTWQKGFSSLNAGDILYIRGGTYTPSGAISNGALAAVGITGKKGTSGSMFNVFAYPGEYPILDCHNLTNTSYEKIGILLYNCDYWYLKGLEITRAEQTSSSKGGQGFMIQSGNNNKMENLVSHHNGGPGFGLREMCEGNLFLNCDAYSNYDPYSPTPGDNADGFDIGFITARPGNDRVNTLTGCRAWLNSDDGFDMYQNPGYHPIYYLKDCWAWKNGYRSDNATKGGNGNGFKYGDDANYTLDAVIRRYTYNCIAYANRQRGFSQESANVKMVFYNNTAYKNGSWGFSFYSYDVADILRNNISSGNPDGAIENQGTKRIHDHNSWDGGVTVSDADFASVDGTELLRARNSDGSLPDISFLHLASGSDLIDAGVNVNLPYIGTVPDIGAFETQSKSTATVPAYSSAVIGNATPAVLEMTYNTTLADIKPAASSFTVLVNSAARAVNSVAISGTKVLLTLSSPVVYGDVVTVAYTKPSTNPLQTSSGTQAVSITAQNVTNQVIAVIPVYVSSTVENAAPTVVQITFSLTLSNITPAASSFSVQVNSSAAAVSSVAVSGTNVQLTLSSPVVYGNVVTVAYNKPASSPLQTASGSPVETFSAKTVSNKLNAILPVYVSSVIENATPSVLEITYSQTLANITPSRSSFSVRVNSTSRTVNSVSVSGTKVKLTLSSPVVYGNTVTVAYTKPSTNPLQTSTGAQAATSSSKTVTNNVIAVIPVYVSSVVENATPSVLEMTYNLSLASVIPAASSFSVIVNSVARTVSSVSVSGTKVKLTLSSPVVYGNTITVAYTKPSTNPLQSASGAQAATFSAKTVTNNVTALVPAYVSSAIENATPSVLEMTYNISLANIIPAASSFSVKVNSIAKTVNSVSVSGTKVSLTLSSPVLYGNLVTVAYTKPTVSPLQSAAGSQAVTFTDQTVTNRVSSVSPVYVSSAVENATPTILTMTYNVTLASISPAASTFSVLVNSTARTVSAVAISGTKVLLTLSSPVIYGNTVTVSYTKPTTNPLQTASGGQASSITAKAVTNNVSAVLPVFTSAVVENATPSRLDITYNITLANIIPATSSFSVTVNSVARSVTSVAVSGTKVLLTLSSPVAYGNSVTVGYAKPSTNPLQTASGAQAATYSAKSVTNRLINISPVTAITSPLNNSSFTAMSNITIKANASDADGTIAKVDFYNGSTIIGSSTTAPYSFTWNNVGSGSYSLTTIATDNNNARTRSSAIIISVISLPAVNLSPVIEISNPLKGNSFVNSTDIEVEMVASDPDGTVSKVELYNGSIKLAELTSAPYVYTWKSVSAGSYTINAVATDNSNATTTSSSVEFKVDDKFIYDSNSEIINLYPNPSDGHFTIEFLTPLKNAKSEIVISDLSGKQIYKAPLSPEELVKEIDISQVRTGTYIMSIINSDIIITKKIIKN